MTDPHSPLPAGPSRRLDEKGNSSQLPQATASTFYRKLDETLDQIGFTTGVREICRPAYADASKGGRPVIPIACLLTGC